MAKIITDNSHYINIANNLRENLGVEETYKPEEMADKITDVYKAGQDSMIDPDKIIPKSASGNPIYLDDVSEIPHDVNIQLTSDSITDFSDVNVTVYGKNLFREDKLILKNTYLDITSEYEGEGIFHVYGSHTNNTDASQTLYLATTNMHIPIEANSSYTLHVELVSGTIQSAGVVPYLYTSNGTKTANWLNISIDNTVNVGTVLTKTYTGGQYQTDAVMIEKFQFYRNIGVGKTLEMDARIRIWLTRSKTTSGYEPSKYITYTANADGTVEGVKSLSPYMNIYSDSDVNLFVDYHKSYGIDTENKRFWDGVTQSNERTIFTYGFHCWDVEYLRPPYKIKPTAINYAFFSTRNLKYIEKDYFDFSACNTASAFSGSMRNNASLKVIEDCNFPEVNHEDVFMNNPSLTTIERIPVNETMTFTAPNWGGCPKLSEIRFDGVIGTSISFPVSPLSVDSMKNIIGCLKNYSGTDNAGVYTVTFKDECKTTLEAEGATSPNDNLWTEYISDLGWNLA